MMLLLLHMIGINIGSTAHITSVGTIGNNVGTNSAIDLCSVNNNSIITTVSALNFSSSVNYINGINMGSILNTGTLGNNVCSDSRIANCSINDNIVTNDITVTTASLLPYAIESDCLGINIGSVISFSNTGTAIIGANTAVNTTVDNCSINNNTINSNLNSSGIGAGLPVITNSGFCTGITIASLLRTNQSSPPPITIGNGTGAANTVSNCTVNGNTGNFLITSGQNTGDTIITFFGGITIASTVQYTGAPNASISTGAGNGCSIDNCSIQNNNFLSNIPTSNDSLINRWEIESVLTGINMSAAIFGGAIQASTALDCSISNVRITDNNCAVPATPGTITTMQGASFVGINLSSDPTTFPVSPFFIISGSIAGNSCNNCTLTDVKINSNTSSAQTASFAYGVLLNGIAQSVQGGCNNITAHTCFVQSNTTNGSFVGFLANGSGITGLQADVITSLHKQ